jgi:hypothetical protein
MRNRRWTTRLRRVETRVIESREFRLARQHSLSGGRVHKGLSPKSLNGAGHFGNRLAIDSVRGTAGWRRVGAHSSGGTGE